MHPSAYMFATRTLTPEQVKGKRVVEVGAYDYNGTARHAIVAFGPAQYIGTDMQPGPAVDLVCPAEKLPDVLTDPADILLSLEMLEHAEDWRGAVTGMMGILAPGGVLLLTTRGPGFPFHPHPGDYHRFTVAQMAAIAGACGLEVVRCEPDPDPASPGVFLLARKPAEGWDGSGMAEGLAAVEPGPPR